LPTGKETAQVKIFAVIQICLALAFLAVPPSWSADELKTPNGVLVIQGKVEDPTGNPVGESEVELFLNGSRFVQHEEAALGGKAEKEHKTGTNGLFSIRVHSPPETIRTGQWALKVTKPSYSPSTLVPIQKILDEGADSHGVARFSARLDTTLQRHQGAAFWIALLVLVGVYVLIALELVHRTLAALLGAAVILAISHTFGHFYADFRMLTFEQSLRAVDWNVIFLLMGMMIIVGVIKESGVFQWIAYKSFQMTKGRIFLLAAALCVVTAVLSAFLDNVTTMLLLTPVSIEIALVLGISPFALLVPEIMASNFGGTATLIGDPPNIMIGSYAGLTFNDFLIRLTPVVIVVMAAQVAYTKWYYGKDYREAHIDDVPKMIDFLREKYRIADFRILWTGGTILMGVILLFVLHGFFHMEVSVAALLGGALVLIANRTDPIEVFERDIEWPSLVFFIMLFVIVGAAEETGILQFVADWIMQVCKGSLVLAIILILWTSAILSAIVDNIPFTATMLPVVALLTRTIPGAESGVLWWALALGACFGGNATIIGASANVITTGIAEKSGHRISFYAFLKHGTPITVVSLVASTISLLVVLR